MPKGQNFTKSFDNFILFVAVTFSKWCGSEVSATPKTGIAVHHSKGQAMQGMSMHSEMMGIKMNLESLKNASEFDKEFVRQMIPQHEPAVIMFRMVVNNAAHPEICHLAEAILKLQTAEFQQM